MIVLAPPVPPMISLTFPVFESTIMEGVIGKICLLAELDWSVVELFTIMPVCSEMNPVWKLKIKCKFHKYSNSDKGFTGKNIITHDQ